MIPRIVASIVMAHPQGAPHVHGSDDSPVIGFFAIAVFLYLYTRAYRASRKDR